MVMLNRLYRLAAWLLAFGLMASVALPSGVQAQSAEQSGGDLTMYVFMSETCPHCQAQKPFLRNLEAEHDALSIESMEVMTTDEHHDLLRAMAAAHEVRAGSVPMVFLGGEVWVGDSGQIRTEIRQTVERCLSEVCADPRQMATEAAETAEPEQAAALIRLPLIGEIDLAVQPLMVSTLMIAFVDGFNPCSIWILTILLALVLHSGSRGRVVLVGLTFLLTTAAIYGGFIAGVFSVLAYAAYLPWVYWIVALFALVFGVVNVKDYFWFKRGFSFTIDDKHKPGIFKGFRELMVNGKSPLALMGATIVMAGGIALIELPCTAGFPVIWSGLVNANDVTGMAFLGLLAVYLSVYLLIELVIFLIAVVKLRIDRFQEGHGRILKLIGGVIMIALAIVLLAAPELMSGIGSSMGVFLGAFAFTGLIVVMHRYVLPKLGIRIGDGW